MGVELGIAVTARDGVVLLTDVYHPHGIHRRPSYMGQVHWAMAAELGDRIAAVSIVRRTSDFVSVHLIIPQAHVGMA